MAKVLHVGCGGNTIKNMPPFFHDGSWEEVRLDINPDVKPDVIGTITDLSAVPSGSIKAVFSSHNVEHVYAYEVPLALAEFRRVLSPNGYLLVTCPDMQTLGTFLAEDKLDAAIYQSVSGGAITPLDILYGHRGSLAAGNHYMAHKCGFTLRTLTEALQRSGFAQVAGARRIEGVALWALATASVMPQGELRTLAQRMFPL